MQVGSEGYGEMELHPFALKDEAGEWQGPLLQAIEAYRTTCGLHLQTVYLGRLKSSREG